MRDKAKKETNKQWSDLPGHDFNPARLVVHEVVCVRHECYTALASPFLTTVSRHSSGQLTSLILGTAGEVHPVIPVPDPNRAAAVVVQNLHTEALDLVFHLGGLVELHVALDFDGVELLAGDG